jgi:L-rhamnose mutarotase
MKLKPGNEALYKQRHDDLWPEMRALMAAGPIRSFSIYRYGLIFARMRQPASYPCSRLLLTPAAAGWP